MQIVRDQPVTGDPAKRTPRQEILPVFTEQDLVELDLLKDASDSEDWGPPDRPFRVWPVQLRAAKVLVSAVQGMDSQMAREMAERGDDEEGGAFTGVFNDTLVWAGDLNESNFDRKIAALRDPRDHQSVPHGGTTILPVCRALDRHYLEEFAKDEKTGQWVPVPQRPKRARGVLTDGAMNDYRDFGARLALEAHLRWLDDLEKEFQGLWPAEEWFVGILGQGDDHDATVKLYQEIAEKHRNVHVYAFTGVQNGDEIGEDMAFAMLNRK